MGVILSLIALPAHYFHSRREKKKQQQAQQQLQRTPVPLSTSTPSQSQPRPPLEQSSAPPPDQAQAPAAAAGQASIAAPVPARAITTSTSPATEVSDASKSASADTTTKTDTKMASDEDYMSFLNKANEDPSAGTAKSTSKGGKLELKSVDKGEEVPKVLREPTENEEWIYISDADEPFVAVALKLKGGLPDEKTFAQLVDHPDPSNADITIQDVSEWDTRGQYKEVVEAVREAAQGSDVRVYRVPSQGARVEYWVVGVDKKEGRLVGVKALAVES